MKKVTIIGIGALGSHVLLFARNWNVTLKVIDFDRVEQKNTLAQMHTKMSLGRNKAQAAQQGFLGMFGLKVEAIPHKLAEDNAEQLLGGSDLVLDCTDNIAARQLIMRTAETKRIPTLHGTLSAAGDFSRVMWTEHFQPDAESGTGATCEDGVQLPFFALAAAHMAQEAQHFLKNGTKRSFQITPTSVSRLA